MIQQRGESRETELVLKAGIRRLIVDALIPRNIAARVKFPASATATKYCNSSNSIDTYPDHQSETAI
jgi:hypothetical protein